MSFEKFAVWLSGFADLNMGKEPSKEQWELIVERLAETFDAPKQSIAPKITVTSAGGASGGYVDPNYGAWATDTKAIARTLEARMGDHLNSVCTAQAVPISALSNSVTAVPGNIASQGSAITTLQSRVTKAE